MMVDCARGDQGRLSVRCCLAVTARVEQQREMVELNGFGQVRVKTGGHGSLPAGASAATNVCGSTTAVLSSTDSSGPRRRQRLTASQTLTNILLASLCNPTLTAGTCGALQRESNKVCAATGARCQIIPRLAVTLTYE